MTRYKLVFLIILLALALVCCACAADAPAPVIEKIAAENEQAELMEAGEEALPPAEPGEGELAEPEAETEPEETEPPAAAYGVDFDSVWGALMEANGGELPWGTLTAEQQALVNYPRFDANAVYWTAGGESYHAVDYCYTLGRSADISSGSLDEARTAGKTDPCSKCVGE